MVAPVQSVLIFLSLVTPLLSGGCDGGDLFDASGSTPPDALFERARQAQPEVLSVSMSNNSSGNVDVIVRFSESMQQNSVESSMAVVTATSAVQMIADGTPQTLAGTYDWREDAREVFFRVTGTDFPLLVVIADSAEAQSGLRLDGKADHKNRADIGSFHRFEDDGFQGPATYVSLPFYPAGTRNLDTHPSFLLSNARPGIVCQDLQFETPVSTGALGTYQAGEPIRCKLDDRRFVPDRNDIAERTPPRAWSPDALPTAVFQQGGTAGTQVPGMIGLGASGNLPIADNFILIGVRDDHGVVVSIAMTGEEDFSHAFIAPVFRNEPVWPITGATQGQPNSLLWIERVLLTGTASIVSTDNPKLIADDDGQAWLQNEWAGQRLHRIGGGFSSQIASNRANQLLLNDSAPADMDYEIRARSAGQYAAGQIIRLTSDHFTVTPETPLAPGTWELILSGGRDLQGLAATDGVRDGDEINDIPNDRSKYMITVP